MWISGFQGPVSIVVKVSVFLFLDYLHFGFMGVIRGRFVRGKREGFCFAGFVAAWGRGKAPLDFGILVVQVYTREGFVAGISVFGH